eukprot:540868_1
MAQLPDSDNKQEEKKEEKKQEPQDNKSGCPTKTEFKYADDETKRWSSINTVLTRGSLKFAPGPFDPEEDNLEILQEDYRVLVVGAGGLG